MRANLVLPRNIRVGERVHIWTLGGQRRLDAIVVEKPQLDSLAGFFAEGDTLVPFEIRGVLLDEEGCAEVWELTTPEGSRAVEAATFRMRMTEGFEIEAEIGTGGFLLTRVEDLGKYPAPQWQVVTCWSLVPTLFPLAEKEVQELWESGWEREWHHQTCNVHVLPSGVFIRFDEDSLGGGACLELFRSMETWREAVYIKCAGDPVGFRTKIRLAEKQLLER